MEKAGSARRLLQGHGKHRMPPSGIRSVPGRLCALPQKPCGAHMLHMRCTGRLSGFAEVLSGCGCTTKAHAFAEHAPCNAAAHEKFFFFLQVSPEYGTPGACFLLQSVLVFFSPCPESLHGFALKALRRGHIFRFSLRFTP